MARTTALFVSLDFYGVFSPLYFPPSTGRPWDLQKKKKKKKKKNFITTITKLKEPEPVANAKESTGGGVCGRARFCAPLATTRNLLEL
jgi:predicted small lipoprotein YifL